MFENGTVFVIMMLMHSIMEILSCASYVKFITHYTSDLVDNIVRKTFPRVIDVAEMLFASF